MEMNNQCDQDIISAAVDGELSPDDMAQFEKHIKSCQTCRDEYQECKQLSLLYGSLPKAQMPDGFAEDILKGYEDAQVLDMEKQALRQWQSQPRRRTRWVTMVAGVAAIILAFVAVVEWKNSAPKDLMTSIVASAEGPVSAMDVVYSFSPEKVEVGVAEKATVSDEFLLVTNVEEGTLRISMASAGSMNLSDAAKILDIPIRLKNGRNNNGYLRLESVRAYQPDGQEIPATLDHISVSIRPRSEASSTVSSV